MGFRKSPDPYLAAAAALVVLAFALFAWAERLRPHDPQVVYTLTPQPSIGVVKVTVEFYGLTPGRLLLVAPDAVAGTASGPPGLDFAGQPAEPLAPTLWWARADRRGRLSLAYEVRPHAIDTGHALLYGAETFVVPLRSDPRAALFRKATKRRVPGAARRIAIRFQMPIGWDAYTPWAEPAPVVEVPGGRFAALRESFVALGDYLPHPLVAAGSRVLVVTRGTDPAHEDALVKLVTECLEAHARAVGPAPHARLLVVADHPFRGDQAAGETARNAASLSLSRDPVALASRTAGRVVAHELFHFWNGGAVDLDAPELRWFAEGTTDYYALRALRAVGRLDAPGFTNELAASFDALRGNPWADSTLAALGRGYAVDPRAWSATYAKGLLASWALDLRLADEGGLDAFVQSLVSDGARPDLGPRLARFRGGRAAGLLDSLSGPRLRPAVEAELAARGMRLARHPSDRWTLGVRFFHPGTTQVVDLDPDGSAARQGVRLGDRIVSVNGKLVGDLAGLADALTDAGGAPIELGLERQGDTLGVSVAANRAWVTEVVEIPARAMATRVPRPGEPLP